MFANTNMSLQETDFPFPSPLFFTKIKTPVSLSAFVYVLPATSLPSYLRKLIPVCASIFIHLSFPIFLLTYFSLACHPSFLLPSGPGASTPAYPCGVMPLIPTAYKQLVLWSPAIWSPVTPLFMHMIAYDSEELLLC